MAPTVLRPEERQRLSNQILAKLYEFSGGTPRYRRVLSEQAGLSRFLGGLDLHGMARTVAGRIVNRFEPYGLLLPERPNYHALGSLLSFLLTIGGNLSHYRASDFSSLYSTTKINKAQW